LSADGPHRHLHSFPTRRSSDLLPRPEPRIAEAVDQGRDQVASIGGLAMRQQGALQDEPHVEALDALCGPIRRELFGADPPHLLRDRKSTRLNSSHVSISYAVFC